MNTTRPALETMFKSTNCWTVDPKGLFSVGFFDKNFDEWLCTYTSEEFAQLHPLLPASILALACWVTEKYNAPYVYGYSIGDTLSYLRHGALKLETAPGSTRYIVSISDLHEDATAQSALIRCRCVELGEQELNGELRAFVVNTGAYDLEVEKEDLERQFPGALTRWQVGLELGLVGTELMKYAFTSASSSQALPSNIIFP